MGLQLTPIQGSPTFYLIAEYAECAEENCACADSSAYFAYSAYSAVNFWLLVVARPSPVERETEENSTGRDRDRLSASAVSQFSALRSLAPKCSRLSTLSTPFTLLIALITRLRWS